MDGKQNDLKVKQIALSAVKRTDIEVKSQANYLQNLVVDDVLDHVVLIREFVYILQHKLQDVAWRFNQFFYYFWVDIRAEED